MKLAIQTPMETPDFWPPQGSKSNRKAKPCTLNKPPKAQITHPNLILQAINPADPVMLLWTGEGQAALGMPAGTLILHTQQASILCVLCGCELLLLLLLLWRESQVRGWAGQVSFRMQGRFRVFDAEGYFRVEG